MKKSIVAWLAAGLGLASHQTYGYSVYMPPGNIVQNPTFQDVFADWSGNIGGVGNGWSSMPDDNGALASDIYQDLPTSPGQGYSISFYAAADLWLAPSVTIDLNLNGQTLTSYITPPYAYNSGLNRIDQMQWEYFTASFVASTSTTKLEFDDINTYDFGLAAVSVIAIPEPSPATPWAVAIILGCSLRSSWLKSKLQRF